MASENVFEVAKKQKLWDGKEPIKFWRSSWVPNYAGKWHAFSVREFFILRTIAPSLNFDENAEELPFSVKPDKKLNATDVMALLRQTYEVTRWDVTSNLKVLNKDRKTGQTDTIMRP